MCLHSLKMRLLLLAFAMLILRAQAQTCLYNLNDGTTVPNPVSTCTDCFIGCNSNPECTSYSWEQYMNVSWANDQFCASIQAPPCKLFFENGTNVVLPMPVCSDCFYLCNYDPQCTLYMWNQSGALRWDNDAYCSPEVPDSSSCRCDSYCEFVCMAQQPAECTHIFRNGTINRSVSPCVECYEGCNRVSECYLYKWNGSGEMLWNFSGYCA